MKRLALLLSVAGLAGCSLEPAYVRPQPAVPGSWPLGAAYPSQAGGAARPADYRNVVQDPRLAALIGQALSANQDLRAAVANVEIARAQYHIQRAELFPHLNAAAGASQAYERGDTTRSYDAEAVMPAFELDLFGRLRSLSHAAQEEYLATEAGADAARLSVIGAVADAWLALAADRSLLAIAAETEASADKDRTAHPGAAQRRRRAALRPQPGANHSRAGPLGPRPAHHPGRPGP